MMTALATTISLDGIAYPGGAAAAEGDIVLRLLGVIPELIMLLGACLCLATGLWQTASVRRTTPWVAGAALVLAGLAAVLFPGPVLYGTAFLGFATYFKVAVACVGLVLLLVAAGVPDTLRQVVATERAAHFEPGDTIRGEFYAFFLFSLTGVMLTAGASDLVWLFLALELTSLPTYVMVATARDRLSAQESAVKYFFLGALSAAVFLYGFALIYGATGFTDFYRIRLVLAMQATTGQLEPLLVAGLLLSITGIAFKLAAFPMHAYAADVYEGANVSVTAFLAFVPKAAGAAALLLLLSLVAGPGGEFPLPVTFLLWAMAAATMTLGNVLALWQDNVKRALAYSSIAHSGYILVGILAGTGLAEGIGTAANGVAAVLFYLVAYGLSTIAAFAVLGCLRVHGEEAQTFDDLAGLRQRHPVLAGIMVVAVLSLLGFPPTVGFVGKLWLGASAVSAGWIWLVVLLVINSAISAVYYLRIASVCFFGEPAEGVEEMDVPARRIGAAVAAFAALALGLFGFTLLDTSENSAIPANRTITATPARPPVAASPVARVDAANDPLDIEP